MDLPIGLTLEQQFNLKVYQQQIQGLSQEEAQAYLIEVLRQLMLKDNLVKHMLKNGI
ncbi:MAG: NblA/ycf18 family protein [Cyanosarcina radialis HA8281-LM2]|jgi:hypothetical protein|nr:NblA/ycf18 family protein [Cyanosarcina radialis HA8281-LM2]